MKLIENATVEKLRGAFYTPEPIASFILKWGVNGSADYDILEPSCGDGVFLEQLKANNHKFNSITAIEFDKTEAEKANKILLDNSTVINTDFHLYCNETPKQFNLIVGNPPYIRYQYFDKDQQKEADTIFKKAKLKYSKLTNAWVSFVVGSSLLLKEKGKIGFVIPAELLQVSYAQQLREFLAHFYNKINIISFEKLVFPNIQQEVVLLLCEKNGENTHLIEHLELRDAYDLEKLDVNKLRCPNKKIDNKASKWTYYFLSQEEIDFLDSLKSNRRLNSIKKYARNEVGITTGKNEFFTVNETIVHQFNLKEYAKPLMGRSIQLNGLTFNKNDWKENVNLGARAYLLVFPSQKEMKENNPESFEYIEYGENHEYHKGYKCRIRGKEWQIVPSLKIPEVFFTRQIHLFPKMVFNEANAYTTDTVHRVYMKENVNANAFVVSFYNSISLAFSEIVGRSYGGGVLELMPNEVEEILIPYKIENAELFPTIDKMMRKKNSIDDILKITNEKILKDGYGFTDEDIKLADSIWKKLSTRRLNRNK
ncbi:MAG: class I SAM-dependent methyltransferase [Prevotella sp.]|jgi:adenine-specific DNA methylase|nr:class I SAM-dependent methyltransferase [Prevotella sp.]